MKPVPSQEWFKKHEGHNITVNSVLINGKPAGLTDYKCMDCKSGLITSQKPGDKPQSARGMVGSIFGGKRG